MGSRTFDLPGTLSLDTERVRQIRELAYRRRMSLSEIAGLFGLDPRDVWRLITGQTGRDLPGPISTGAYRPRRDWTISREASAIFRRDYLTGDIDIELLAKLYGVAPSELSTLETGLEGQTRRIYAETFEALRRKYEGVPA